MGEPQRAKREGVCKDCGQPIRVGDAIGFVVAWGFVHDQCHPEPDPPYFSAEEGLS